MTVNATAKLTVWNARNSAKMETWCQIIPGLQATVSLSITVIKKNKNVSLQETLTNYINALNQTFTKAEVTNGFLFNSKGMGCLGFVFDTRQNIEPVTLTELEITPLRTGITNLVMVKILVEIDAFKPNTILDKISRDIKTTANINLFCLEHTAMITKNLADRPPRFLENGSIYFPVGGITQYFSTDEEGTKFANKFPKSNFSEIVARYYSQFTKDGKLSKLVTTKTTKLRHFTVIINPNQTPLAASFLQNENINIARWVENPNTVYCSNESLLRSFRFLQYQNSNDVIHSGLKINIVEI